MSVSVCSPTCALPSLMEADLPEAAAALRRCAAAGLALVELRRVAKAPRTHVADRSLAGGYALSRTSARELVFEWLEQQAQRGRSRRLVPELLALEGPWWPSSCFLATS